MLNAHRNAHGTAAVSQEDRQQMSSPHVVLTPGLPRVSKWAIIQSVPCCIVLAKPNGVVS